MKQNHWRVFENPTLYSVNVFANAFKRFDKSGPWEAWTKEEAKIVREEMIEKPLKSMPAFLKQLEPGKYADNGLFRAIVRARETAWILKENNVNLDIKEFVDYSDCWKRK